MEQIKKEKAYSDEEYIFETSEDIEVYTSFDEIGLREDLIKGILFLNKVFMRMDLINHLQFNKEQLYLLLKEGMLLYNLKLVQVRHVYSLLVHFKY